MRLSDKEAAYLRRFDKDKWRNLFASQEELAVIRALHHKGAVEVDSASDWLRTGESVYLAVRLTPSGVDALTA